MKSHTPHFRLLVISLILFILALLTAVSYTMTSHIDWVFLTLAIACCCISMLPFVRGYLSGNIDWMEPVYLFGLLYMMYFGLRSLHISIDPSTVWFYTLMDFDRTLFIKAVLIASLGIIMLFAGYYFPVISLKPICHAEESPSMARRSRRITLFLWAVGWLGRVYIILTGRYIGIVEAIGAFGEKTWRPLDAVVGLLVGLPPLIIAITLVKTLSKRDDRTYLLPVLIMIVFEIFYASISSTRGTSIVLVFLILMAFYNAKRKVMVLPSIIAFAFIVSVVFPVVGAYRHTYWEVYGHKRPTVDAESIKEQIDAMGDHILQSYSILNTLDEISRHSYGVDSLAAAIKITPVTGWYYGESYVNALVQLIPRILYPGRPPILDLAFEERFIGMERTGLGDTVVQVPLMAEAYINGGIIGVMLVLFINGVLLKCIFILFGKSNSYAFTGFYIYSLSHLISIEHSFVTIYANDLLKLSLVYLPAVFWIAGKNILHKRTRFAISRDVHSSGTRVP